MRPARPLAPRAPRPCTLFAPSLAQSGFALRHSTLLRLVRAEGASAATVLSRSLREWQARADERARASRRDAVARELRALDAEAEASGALRGADQYLQLRARLSRQLVDGAAGLSSDAAPCARLLPPRAHATPSDPRAAPP